MINLKYKKYYLGICIFCCSVLNCSLSLAQLKDSARLIEAEDALKPNDEVLQSLDMEIQSLLITNSKRIAQINGKFYVIGDITKAGKLVAIFKDRIVVAHEDQMRVIFMKPRTRA